MRRSFTVSLRPSGWPASAAERPRPSGDSARPRSLRSAQRSPERDVPRSASLVRAAAAMTAVDHGIWIVEPALDDRDRVVVLAALDSLDAARGGDLLEPGVLDALLLDATALAERAYAAGAALADVRRVRWSGRSTTRSTSLADSSSQCWRSGTVKGSAQPCASSIAKRANGVRSQSRLSTSCCRATKPRSPFRS